MKEKLESDVLETVGERLAVLEREAARLRRGPICDALEFAFFLIEILPDESLVAKYRCPKCHEWLGDIPKTMADAVGYCHPEDAWMLNECGSESLMRIRLRTREKKFEWFITKQIFTPTQWTGMMFKPPANVLGFSFTEDPNDPKVNSGPFAS